MAEAPRTKRKQPSFETELPTPPSEDHFSIQSSKRRRLSSANISSNSISSTDNDLLNRAVHVLSTEAAALTYISNLYQHSTPTRDNLLHAVQAITSTHHKGNKLIVCGVGKSAYIAQKLVATFKSLGVSASFMHACEAAHGDLGDVRQGDVVMFISYSGRTPELLNLLPHFSEETVVIALSSQTRAEDCRLLDGRGGDLGILLPAPTPETEEDSFGVAAPTTSTIMAMAVADMLALTVTEEIHGFEKRREIFKKNHPGGAIGMNHREVEKLKKDGEVGGDGGVTVLELPSPSISAGDGD